MKRKKVFSKFDARLLRALIAVLTLSLLFGMGVRYYLVQHANRQCKEQLEQNMLSFQKNIQELEEERSSDPQALWRQFRLRLCYTGLYFINWELSDENWDWDIVYLLDSRFTNGCGASAVLLDKEGKVVSSSRELMYFTVYNEESYDMPFEDRLYLCDPAELQVPELERMFTSYQYSKDAGIIPIAELTGAYVNRETHSFVPCTGCVDGVGEGLINIHAELPGYELVSFEQQLQPDMLVNQNEEYKQAYFFGERQSVLDELAQIKPYTFGAQLQSPIIQYVEFSDGYAVYDGVMQVEILGVPYWLNVRFKLNYNADTFREFSLKAAGLFALICGVIAVIIYKRKTRKEKAYQESFRTSLTDSLAHDVKTPLMAISGYTENVLNGKLSEAEEKEYLHSILDNVSYTDDLISRTLYLNHMEQAKKSKPEAVQLAPLAEKLLTKYDLMLRKKRIQTALSGSAEVRADPAALETILENLISNAVKYTPEGGKIQIKMDKKTLTVTNTVTQKLDVKKLKEPFVRGDAARSNVKGNGLGLAIADRTAKANGFKLKLSCTDTEFQAELRH